MKIKDTQLAIGTIGLIIIFCLIVSYALGIVVSDTLVFGAFTAIAGLAGFEAGRGK